VENFFAMDDAKKATARGWKSKEWHSNMLKKQKDPGKRYIMAIACKKTRRMDVMPEFGYKANYPWRGRLALARISGQVNPEERR
jgi:hypothetical protein